MILLLWTMTPDNNMPRIKTQCHDTHLFKEGATLMLHPLLSFFLSMS
jgi:hypothetical protein